MKRLSIALLALSAMAAGCSRRSPATPAPQPSAYGSALVEIGGGKQVASVGMPPDQPIVVQVNDSQGNAVAGAPVSFRGPAGVVFAPAAGLSDSSGQFSTVVSLGGIPGRYQLVAATKNAAGKVIELKVEEIALGWQQMLGQQINRQYCDRCHNPESTPERVSNYDNLAAKPHPFTEGATLNRMSDSDLVSIISHGGPALGKSPEMPPYGYTIGKNEIEALVAYIRAVSDPPYRTAGLVYAQ